MTNISRRNALFTGAALIGSSSAACSNNPSNIDAQFLHGVASGDMTHDSVILWTRVTPLDDGFTGSLHGRWEISATKEFEKIIKRGKFTASAATDFTVKIDAQRLKPGQTYYYRFRIGKILSPIGRTKTLPLGHIDSARFAVVSCSNYPFGFFNVYDYIAKQTHFDAVIHLGDYFYEYGRDGYGGHTGAKLGREHEPAHETITLPDYRTRHAQYKRDTAAQALHAAHPIICIWDDHETANNSWKTGAQNHNAGEGDWDARRTAAMQAYYEWMPVRNPAAAELRAALFRSYSWGDLLTITTLETRLTARSRQLEYAQYQDVLTTPEELTDFENNILGDPSREMLGAAQMQHITDSLKHSKEQDQPWRVIANQIIFASMRSPDMTGYKPSDPIAKIVQENSYIEKIVKMSPLGLPVNLDAWDGYPAARERFYDAVRALDVRDLLVLTGDTHVSWANHLRANDGADMGVELGVTGTTSPGYHTYLKGATEDYNTRLRAKNPGIVWNESAERGFIDLQLNHKAGRVDFVSVSTVHSTDYTIFTSKSFALIKQGSHIKIKSG